MLVASFDEGLQHNWSQGLGVAGADDRGSFVHAGPDGSIYVIEANPNPQLAFDEEFAESAAHVKITYEDLIHRILTLGLGYRAHWRQ